MNPPPVAPRVLPDGAEPKSAATVFGVNEVRLSLRQWALVGILFLGIALGLPRLWKRIEVFETGPDYRIPYALSRDYWLYARRLEAVPDPASVLVLGDSVVWGEYVRPDGTLSHFLSRESGRSEGFVNAGVNGLFPLALEGLVDHYGGGFRGRRVLLHCNLLWMTSPKADLSIEKEEAFNHSRLVAQFRPRIPCYRADTSERLGALVEREFGLLQWVGHLENAYFGQQGIPRWTLADDGGDPPRYPNLFRNPLAQVTLKVPAAPANDPDRGPASPRHRPWNQGAARPVDFEWVDAGVSLQWPAFRRVVQRLRERGADVFVAVGPFNESMLAETSRPAYRKLLGNVESWLKAEGVPHVLPEPLPSALYADASHPLTAGYELLAKRLWAAPEVQGWWRR